MKNLFSRNKQSTIGLVLAFIVAGYYSLFKIEVGSKAKLILFGFGYLSALLFMNFLYWFAYKRHLKKTDGEEPDVEVSDTTTVK